MKKNYVTPKMEIDVFDDKVSLIITTSGNGLSERAEDTIFEEELDNSIIVADGSFASAANGEGPSVGSFASAAGPDDAEGDVSADSADGADSTVEDGVTSGGSFEQPGVENEPTVDGTPDIESDVDNVETETPSVDDVVGIEPGMENVETDAPTVDDIVSEDGDYTPEDGGVDAFEPVPEVEVETAIEPFAQGEEPVIEDQPDVL